jgi:UPF0716 protein FxsA
MSQKRRRGVWAVLAVLFVVVPLLEIYILIQVGQVIGAWWTILLLVADSILGSYLVKHEGGRAWQALRDAIESNRMPAKELADGALILIGGTLLLTPGFLSDVVGAFLILPFTRPVARGLLTRVAARKLVTVGGVAYTGGPSASASRPGTRQSPGTDESVVRGEVVND